MKVGLAELKEWLPRLWSAETARDGKFDPRCPASEQCVPTAIVVARTLGGDILFCRVKEDWHYFNRLPDGTEVDLTRGQFPEGTEFGPAKARVNPFSEHAGKRASILMKALERALTGFEEPARGKETADATGSVRRESGKLVAEE